MLIELKQPYFGKPAGTKEHVPEDLARTLIAQGIAHSTIEQGISNLLTGTVEKTLDNIQRAQTLSLKGARAAIFGEAGEGDPRRNFGDWCLTALAATSKRTAPADRRDAFHRLETVYFSQKAAIAESSGATGGFLVPPDFYKRLLEIAADESTFRPQAFVLPMSSDTFEFPTLDATTAPASAGTSPFFGGAIANWLSEDQTRTETEPKFKMMELKAQELSGYTVASNVMLKDGAIGLEKVLFTLFGRLLAWHEEYAFFQGNGVGKPVGILNAPASIQYTRQASSLIGYTDVATMLSKFLPASICNGKGCWYCSPTALTSLLQLRDGNNRAVALTIDQGTVKRPTWKLLGLPLYPTERLPALGTKGDLILADPSLYVIGDRMMLDISASPHVNFLNNQMTWRFVQRVDGRPWLDNTVTLQDTTTVVSPFVVLN
jgi:HK97 family phage major capsid protein